MEVHYSKDVIDPVDFGIVHVIFVDSRREFFAWLNENAPSHTFLREPDERRVGYLGSRLFWQFCVKMSPEETAKLQALWPRERH